MQLFSRGRMLRFCAGLAFLAGCVGETPQAPDPAGAPTAGSPSFAMGLYGMAGGPTAPVGRPCTRPEYRQFDFWVGTWDVHSPEGTPVGNNVISRALNGCAVMESYTESGYVGRSLNSFDAASNQWHQHWSDHGGTVLRLFGGSPQAGTMILAGLRPRPTGGPALDRVTWTEHSPDLVNQFWETSLDGGQTFPVVVFDGWYHRVSSVTPAPEIPTGACTNQAFPTLFQFDFTLGSWKVDVAGPHAAVGSPRLTSTISKDLGDCLIEERLSGAAGYEAIVFTTVRRALGEWLKTYVDNQGINVFLKGQLTGGQMVLTGRVPSTGESSRDARVTWVPNGPDSFEQRWETSSDGGTTWGSFFVARYSRR